MHFTKLVIGLTGGIASGKSTVARLFAKFGIEIIDTDLLARDVTAVGHPALTDISHRFGVSILMEDGSLNRRALREIVFADPDKRTWLEALLHPLIRTAVAKQIEASTSIYTIVVIPLLFETLPNPLIQRILLVDTTPDLQLARAKLRDQASEEQIANIVQVQISRAHRLANADDIIYNDADLFHLASQVQRFHSQYLNMAAKVS